MSDCRHEIEMSRQVCVHCGASWYSILDQRRNTRREAEMAVWVAGLWKLQALLDDAAPQAEPYGAILGGTR